MNETIDVCKKNRFFSVLIYKSLIFTDKINDFNNVAKYTILNIILVDKKWRKKEILNFNLIFNFGVNFGGENTQSLTFF